MNEIAGGLNLPRDLASSIGPSSRGVRTEVEGPMFVDPKSRIAGIPALKVRNFLRRAREHCWHANSAADHLGLSAAKARALIAQLLELGYVERAEFPATAGWYKVTLKGAAFGLGSGARAISRRTAERKLAQLVERVREVNRNSYYLYRVRRLIVFGSFLSERDRLNDIDVAVDAVHKIDDVTVREEANRDRIREAQQNGRRFSNLVDQLFWPYFEVLLFLKHRSRALSIHEADDGILDQVTEIKVYEFEELIRAG